MTTITRSEEIAGKDDQIVRVVGVYAVENLGCYRIVSEQIDGTRIQSNKLAYVELEGGGTIRLGARPDAEHEMAGKLVAVTGRLKEEWPPRQAEHVAQPNPAPALIEISAVEPR